MLEMIPKGIQLPKIVEAFPSGLKTIEAEAFPWRFVRFDVKHVSVYPEYIANKNFNTRKVIKQKKVQAGKVPMNYK